VSPLAVAVVALVAGAVLGSLLVPGAPIFAIPVAAVALAVIGAAEFRRRTTAAREMREFRDQAQAEKVDFTARDRETQA
jgi:hypothetical protein